MNNEPIPCNVSGDTKLAIARVLEIEKLQTGDMIRDPIELRSLLDELIYISKQLAA